MTELDTPEMGIINDDGMLVIEQISPNISLTEAGFLLCTNCTISRTGVQEYTTKEIPVQGDEDGNVKAFRSYTEVFRPESIASFENAPVTIEHPPAMITSENWKYHSVGVVSNVRQEGNLLKATLLITDANAIRQVQARGLRFLSCGYNSRLVDNEDGSVEQTYIKGNHVAIVQSPRGGEICSIQDSTTTPLINTKNKQEPKMATKRTMKHKIFKFMGLMDAEADKLVNDLTDDDMDSDTDIADTEQDTPDGEFDKGLNDEDAGEARFSKIEAMLAQIAEAVGVSLNDSEDDEEKEKDVTDSDDEEKEKDVTDSEDDEEKEKDVTDSEDDEEKEDNGETPIADSYRTIISKAEILVPGIKISTSLNDSKNAKFKNASVQRQVLNKLYLTDSGKESIDTFTGNKGINKLSNDSINILFNSAVALKTQQNNMVVARTITLNDSKATTNKLVELNSIHKKLNHN